MRVTVDEIREKIKDLPANVRDLVTIGEKGSARVKSFTSQKVYDIHLEPYKSDPENKNVLNATCGCAAHKLCHHVVAFWAVAKEEVPVAGFVGGSGDEPAKAEEDALSAPDLTGSSMEFINGAALWIGVMREAVESLERRVSELEKRLEE